MHSIFGGDYDKVTQLYPIHDSSEKNVVETIQLSSDYAFVCPTQRAAEHLSKKNRNVYVYMWTQATFPPVPRCLSAACHSNEVPYMFQTIVPLIGSRRNALKDQVWNYWTNFAATGNPNLRPDSGKQDTQVPIWPRFEPTVRVVQELGDSTKAMGAQRDAYCKLWNDDLGYGFADAMYPVTVGEWNAIANAQRDAEKDMEAVVERMKQEESLH
jgi:carboxylesterase type B